MSTNVSKEKREKLIEKIKAIKTYIATAKQDENTAQLLTYIAEIEKDIKGKKYGLVFEEHRESIDETLENNLPVLVEDESLFIDNGGQMNFLIEGDNLASLKLLEKTHKGKIDLICIDPPYNTGSNDFMYDDTFIDKLDTFRHSKWLSFMGKRLSLAKSLLADNGFIFINIDENEFSQLKLLCDEIFGENNYVNEIVWQKLSASKSQSIYFSNLHEKILVYRKSDKAIIEKLYLPVDENDKSYPYIEEKTGRKYGSFDFTQSGKGEGRYFGDKFLLPPEGKHWIWGQDRINEGLEKGLIIFTKNGLPRVKKYLDEKKGNLIGDIWVGNDITPLSANSKERVGFDTQKPLCLIKRIISCFPTDKITVLDFFAGSGTTGHAVMKLNNEDGGQRKFILCTNNENNICRDVTYERIKRVIDKEDYKASLKYFKVDFVPISDKLYYEYADELLKHVKELVELENAINFNGNDKIAIILTEEELDGFANAIPETCKTVYLGHDVLPSETQEKIFKKNGITINVIPDYYYRDLEA